MQNTLKLAKATARSAVRKTIIRFVASAFALCFGKLERVCPSPRRTRAIIACTGEGRGEEAITPRQHAFSRGWTTRSGHMGAFLQWDLCLPAGVMVALVGLGLWAIIKVKRWRDEADEIAGLSIQDQIAQYEKMVQDGELDSEEFARIKAQLEATFDAPPPKPDPPAAPPSQPPDTSISEK